jgi:hypothetical protein
MPQVDPAPSGLADSATSPAGAGEEQIEFNNR